MQVGILAPQIRDDSMGFDFECLFYVEAPFREDLKRFNFPPLDRVINREGKELYEHSCLPSKEMQNAMDELLDSMDLMDGDQDEDGEPFPWFRCEDSFNPAIHGIKEAVSWRVFHPNDRALPKPQHEVVKFLQPPEKVANRCAPIAERCRELFDLQYGESPGEAGALFNLFIQTLFPCSAYISCAQTSWSTGGTATR